MPVDWIEHPHWGVKVNSERYPVMAKGRYPEVLMKTQKPPLPKMTRTTITIPDTRNYKKTILIKNTHYSKEYILDILMDMYGPGINCIRGKKIILDIKYSDEPRWPIALRDPNSEIWYFLAPVCRGLEGCPQMALKHLDGGLDNE